MIDGTSAQLKEALESGKQIIVTTLQKFPVIVDSVGKLSGKRFALLIDEAHSSQGGSMAQATVKVLTQDGEEEEDRDYEDMIHDEIAARGKQENISVFAFTATPKSKTLELFGRKLPTVGLQHTASIPCDKPSRRASFSTCCKTTPPTPPIGSLTKTRRMTRGRVQKGQGDFATLCA